MSKEYSMPPDAWARMNMLCGEKDRGREEASHQELIDDSAVDVVDDQETRELHETSRSGSGGKSSALSGEPAASR